MVKGFASAGRPIAMEARLAGASKGIALTTTAAFTSLPKGIDRLQLLPRNFSTAVVARFAFCPYLRVLKTTDSLATATDYSDAAQDADAADDVDLSSLGTLAQGDFLLIGSHVPFRGLNVDIDAANGNAATILVEYWNGSAWTDISATDGTASGGATFAVDGAVTWTVPASWTKERMREMGLTPAAAVGPLQQEPLYWVRVSVSAALDSTTRANGILGMSRSTAYAELGTGERFDEAVGFGPGGIAGVEALTDAGTANLVANCYSAGGFAQS
jgi:hypothetical protein